MDTPVRSKSQEGIDGAGPAERSLTTRHQLRDRMAATVGMEIESTESYVVATLQLVDGA